MPRPPDPKLEERILKAAEVLWKKGGEHALTMRAVAKVAGTNTPAVYRRFKDRDELLRALLLRIAERIRQYFQQGETLEGMADAYVDYALKFPNEYRLFYSHGSLLNPPRRRGSPAPIRQSRPNFAFAEKVAAKQLGGSPEDHTQFALSLWALLHGTATLLLSGTIPSGHEAEFRAACRTGVKSLIRGVISKS
jgi:AcrR family transcriptional regulator